MGRACAAPETFFKILSQPRYRVGPLIIGPTVLSAEIPAGTSVAEACLATWTGPGRL